MSSSRYYFPCIAVPPSVANLTVIWLGVGLTAAKFASCFLCAASPVSMLPPSVTLVLVALRPTVLSTRVVKHPASCAPSGSLYNWLAVTDSVLASRSFGTHNHMLMCCQTIMYLVIRERQRERERELFCNWQSFRLGIESLCDSLPDFSWSRTITGLIPWGVFPNGRTCLSSLHDPLLESSSFDPVWSLLYSTLYWSLHHLTLSGVFFSRPSTGIVFIWPSLESSLLDPLLWSSSLDTVCSLYSTLYCGLLLTLSGVFFTRPSTGVFITWPSLLV
jgi:hypothetical protein